MHCYSLDWHPSDHVSFIDNIHLRQLDPDSKIQDASKAELYQTVVFTGPPKTEQVRISLQKKFGKKCTFIICSVPSIKDNLSILCFLPSK